MLALRKMNDVDIVEQWRYVTALPADEAEETVSWSFSPPHAVRPNAMIITSIKLNNDNTFFIFVSSEIIL